MNSSAENDGLRRLKIIQFELSHRCPNIDKHSLCPLHLLVKQSDVSLPGSLVIDFCMKLKESGNETSSLYFHLYNEPLADPRLHWLVYMIRHVLGMKNEIKIHSSTVGVDDVIIRDLIECGCDHLTFTIPDKETYEIYIARRDRFIKEFPNVLFRIYMKRHDDRLKIYDEDRLLTIDKPTDLPFKCCCAGNYFIISCDADVVLCENDWMKHVKFGNLLRDSLEEIFKKKTLLHDELWEKGNRNATDVCQKCTSQLRPGMICESRVFGEAISILLNLPGVSKVGELTGIVREHLTQEQLQNGLKILGKTWSSHAKLIETINATYKELGVTAKYNSPVCFMVSLDATNWKFFGDIFFIFIAEFFEFYDDVVKKNFGADLEYVSEHIRRLVW